MIKEEAPSCYNCKLAHVWGRIYMWICIHSMRARMTPQYKCKHYERE